MTRSLRELLFFTFAFRYCIAKGRRSSFRSPTQTTTAACITEDGGDVSYSTSCSRCGKEIMSASECETASAAMGLTWKREEYNKDWPSGCHESRYENGATGVFYNRHPSGTELGVNAWSICIYEDEEEEEDEESPVWATVVAIGIVVCCLACFCLACVIYAVSCWGRLKSVCAWIGRCFPGSDPPFERVLAPEVPVAVPADAQVAAPVQQQHPQQPPPQAPPPVEALEEMQTFYLPMAKDGEILLKEDTPGKYRVINEIGIAYRNSKNIDDKHASNKADAGAVVDGSDEGAGWVKIQMQQAAIDEAIQRQAAIDEAKQRQANITLLGAREKTKQVIEDDDVEIVVIEDEDAEIVQI